MLVYLTSVGIITSGIDHWAHAIKLFTRKVDYQAIAVAKKLSTLLPANEQRRATRVTQLALHVAQQLGENKEPQSIESPLADSLATCLQVFSSANGDLTTFDQIAQSLAQVGRPVSPTRFHNSVHNAPAGYWSIGSQSKTPSTSLSVAESSASAGLLEAVVQLHAQDNEQQRDCLLVCYDEIPAHPFLLQTQITTDFACALRLSLTADNALAVLDINLSSQQPPTPLNHRLIAQQLDQSNPQIILLPLLETLAIQQQKTIFLPYLDQSLRIDVGMIATNG
jgi:hypothetical protein